MPLQTHVLNTLLVLITLVLLVFAFSAAAQDMPPDAARVRFTQLSPEAPAIDIYIAGELALENIAYGEVTPYVGLIPEIYEVTITPTGESVENAIFNPVGIEFLPSHDYIIGVIGTVASGSFSRLLIDETLLFTADPRGMATVLFLHAIEGQPPVDVRVEGSDQNFGSGLEFGGYWLTTVAPGEYPMVVSAFDDTSSILLQDLNPMTLEADRLYFVAAAGTADAPEVIVTVTGTMTIADIIATTPGFETLRAFIEAAGLSSELANRALGPYTLFAPNDDAFALAFEALGLEPGVLVEDTAFLEAILRYHITPAYLTLTDLTALAEGEGILPTLQTEFLNISTDGEDLLLNATAHIIQHDILASNGVIHVIDVVLVPPA